MNYFKNCTTLEELRVEYRQLILEFHPDRNQHRDTTRQMQDINAAYEAATKRMTSEDTWSAPHGKEYTENRATYYANLNAKLAEVLYNLLSIDDKIVVEITGYWFWVEHPDSRSIKEELKAIGCRFAGKKKQWYYPGVPSKGRGKYSKAQIRDKYGSKRVKGQGKRSSRKDDELNA